MRAVLKPQAPLERYPSTARNSIRSRAWAAPIEVRTGRLAAHARLRHRHARWPHDVPAPRPPPALHAPLLLATRTSSRAHTLLIPVCRAARCWVVTRHCRSTSPAHSPRLLLHTVQPAQGCSYSVERCWVVTRSGAAVDLAPNLEGLPGAAPTFTPSHMERIVTRSAGAGGRQRQVQVRRRFRAVGRGRAGRRAAVGARQARAAVSAGGQAAGSNLPASPCTATLAGGDGHVQPGQGLYVSSSHTIRSLAVLLPSPPHRR